MAVAPAWLNLANAGLRYRESEHAVEAARSNLYISITQLMDLQNEIPSDDSKIETLRKKIEEMEEEKAKREQAFELEKQSTANSFGAAEAVFSLDTKDGAKRRQFRTMNTATDVYALFCGTKVLKKLDVVFATGSLSPTEYDIVETAFEFTFDIRISPAELYRAKKIDVGSDTIITTLNESEYYAYGYSQCSVKKVLRDTTVENHKLRSSVQMLTAERDAVMAERDAVMAERDAVMAERDALIAVHDVAIAERDALIAQHDEEAASFLRKIARRNRRIARRDGRIARLAV